MRMRDELQGGGVTLCDVDARDSVSNTRARACACVCEVGEVGEGPVRCRPCSNSQGFAAGSVPVIACIRG